MMPKRYLLPFALILLIVLAACGGGTAEPTAVPAVAESGETAEESQEEAMDRMQDASQKDDEAAESQEETGDGVDMDEMADTSQDEEMAGMEVEGHDDDADMEDGEHDDDGMDDGMDDMEGEEMVDDAEMTQASAMNKPPWQTVAMINAITGAEFTLADFQGKTVFVEPMATWCSNCRQQQGEVRQAKAQLGDDVVFLGLSLETNLPAEQLAAYAQSNGFDWDYAVMPTELLGGLADEFGRSITSAPSTPHFVIRPDGTFTELSTGIHSAADIVAEIQAEQALSG